MTREEYTMVRTIVSGCSGRMGQVITALAGEDPQITVVAGIDIAGSVGQAYPVYKTFADCEEEADVIIDFSSPAVFDSMIDYALAHHIPAVVCTTGLSEEQIERLAEAAKETAMLRSANMSLGINVLQKVLKEAAKVLAPAGFDIEIVERHHNRKKDAPSGTALALADSVNAALSEPRSYVYDRSGRFEPRRPDEIGICAVRGGTIVGDHEVIFAGTDEVIEFKHTAYSRTIFAKGAIEAAKFMAGRAPGLYDMSDVIG